MVLFDPFSGPLIPYFWRSLCAIVKSMSESNAAITFDDSQRLPTTPMRERLSSGSAQPETLGCALCFLSEGTANLKPSSPFHCSHCYHWFHWFRSTLLWQTYLSLIWGQRLWRKSKCLSDCCLRRIAFRVIPLALCELFANPSPKGYRPQHNLVAQECKSPALSQVSVRSQFRTPLGIKFISFSVTTLTEYWIAVPLCRTHCKASPYAPSLLISTHRLCHSVTQTHIILHYFRENVHQIHNRIQERGLELCGKWWKRSLVMASHRFICFTQCSLVFGKT